MNLNEGWQLRVRERVYKALSTFPEKDQNRILAAMEALPRNPFTGDIEKMKGEENIWRRRIGSYRIFYELISREKVIYVFYVERRTSKMY